MDEHNEQHMESQAGSDIPAEIAEPQLDSRQHHLKSEMWEWAKSIVSALLLALVLRATVVQAYVIPTGSMEPTIIPKDRVFGNRFIYRFREPERGDIIAFKPPENIFVEKTSDSLLKRVVGVEGDVIRVHNHKLWVNGKSMEEPYIMAPPVYEFPPTKVPQGMVFVMGDNRNDSYDSHMWGPLPRKNIQAKAFFRFWPLNRIGILK